MSKEKRKFIRIPPGETEELWEQLEQAKEHHDDLEGAAIGLGWVIGTRADKDGRLVLARMIRHSERIREQTGLDATIAINAEAWATLSDPQRLALLDHELCHLAQALDKEGDQEVDGHGKLKWRTRRHDLEEFSEVVRRHGIWKADIAAFAQACLDAKKAPLFAQVKAFPISDAEAKDERADA